MLVGIIAVPASAIDVQIATPSAAQPEEPPRSSPDLRSEMAGTAPLYAPPDVGDVVTVMVELSSPTTIDLGLVDMTLSASSEAGIELQRLAAEHRLDMVAEQNEIQRQIAGLYSDALFSGSYTNLLNGFNARIPLKLIEDVANIEGVLAVHLNQAPPPLNALSYETTGNSFGWVEDEFDVVFTDLDAMSDDAYLELMDELGISTQGYQFSWIRPISDTQS